MDLSFVKMILREVTTIGVIIVIRRNLPSHSESLTTHWSLFFYKKHPVSEYDSEPYTCNMLITLMKYYRESRKLVQLVKRLKHLTRYKGLSSIWYIFTNPNIVQISYVHIRMIIRFLGVQIIYWPKF